MGVLQVLALAALVASSFAALADYQLMTAEHHGADNREDIGSHHEGVGESACVDLCDADATCVSFIIQPSTNNCWLQSELRGTDFLAMADYNQYVKSGGCMAESADMEDRIEEVGGGDEWAKIIRGDYDCQGSCTLADSASVCA